MKILSTNQTGSKIHLSEWSSHNLKNGDIVHALVTGKQSKNIYNLILNGKKITAYAPDYDLQNGNHMFTVEKTKPQIQLKPFLFENLGFKSESVDQNFSFLESINLEKNMFSFTLSKYYKDSEILLNQDKIDILAFMFSRENGSSENYQLLDRLSYFVFFLDSKGLLKKSNSKKSDFHQTIKNLIKHNINYQDLLNGNILKNFKSFKDLFLFLGLTFEKHLKKKNSEIDNKDFLSFKTSTNENLIKNTITEQLITSAMNRFYTDSFYFFSVPFLFRKKFRKSSIKMEYLKEKKRLSFNILFSLDEETKVQVNGEYFENLVKGDIFSNNKSIIDKIKSRILDLSNSIEKLGLKSYFKTGYKRKLLFSPFTDLEYPSNIEAVI